MNELQKDGKTEYRSNGTEPIEWIANKNVKELILLSQADRKRRDRSSASTLNESKPKKLTIAGRLQTFSNPETSPEPERVDKENSLRSRELACHPTQIMDKLGEVKRLLKTLPFSWKEWKN
ncbi:hypothetical protein AVEN_15852-1 [Araneus ventricosus]|uniref:Uncharacterized protein n=1 Tax=Araneus ventricosus TaxID=182803 RepID=A0A4Y2KJ59_ARAVE|nr:hypothetical protein AVEN_15852-1 [Araneus ventricosus]